MKSGYSKAAIAVAKVLVELSENATRMGPHASFDELASGLGLSEGDVRDALHELGSLIMVAPGGDTVIAKDELFVTFDEYWKPWNPAADALHLATKLVNDRSLPREPRELAKALGWEPRRFNPATAYLFNGPLLNFEWVDSAGSRAGEARRSEPLMRTNPAIR